jgi:hypothetical protein
MNSLFIKNEPPNISRMAKDVQTMGMIKIYQTLMVHMMCEIEQIN